LGAIDSHGSLRSAASHLKISYQHAWNMIDEMNRIAREPLVNAQRGGKNGGGARLSTYGQSVLKEYRFISSHINSLVEKINVEINL
jgi:molybdate transport system regulatory protein